MSRFIGMARVTPAVLAISAMAGSAQAAQVGSAQQGLRLARSVCSECHLVVKEAGRSNEPAAVASAMQTSHKAMPNVVLKGDELSDIIAYILSLRD